MFELQLNLGLCVRAANPDEAQMAPFCFELMNKTQLFFLQNEIFASRHQDVNSVACIEDKCYVLTLAQYCR